MIELVKVFGFNKSDGLNTILVNILIDVLFCRHIIAKGAVQIWLLKLKFRHEIGLSISSNIYINLFYGDQRKKNEKKPNQQSGLIKN